MDMGSSTVMNMASATTAAATATKTAAMSMGGGSCKISMLWNWTVIDACFISRSWHITSKGMFAGSCIGVILLVMSLELLRRGAVEYDNYLRERHLAAVAAANGGGGAGSSASGSSSPTGINKGNSAAVTASCAPASAPIPPFRPNVLQQAIRALLHTLQFAVAYFVMLLAMYYNGYIIICIFVGAYIGSFVFGWETFKPLRMKEEVTVCCG